MYFTYNGMLSSVFKLAFVIFPLPVAQVPGCKCQCSLGVCEVLQILPCLSSSPGGRHYGCVCVCICVYLCVCVCVCVRSPSSPLYSQAVWQAEGCGWEGSIGVSQIGLWGGGRVSLLSTPEGLTEWPMSTVHWNRELSVDQLKGNNFCQCQWCYSFSLSL